MKIFVSGKIGTQLDPKPFMRELEALGHTITFDWTTIDHLRPYEDNAQASARAAELEIDGVKAADVLVLVSHERGVGMFVELGAALALDKPVIVLAEPPARTMFFFHPLVQWVGTKDAVIASLDAMEVKGSRGTRSQHRSP